MARLLEELAAEAGVELWLNTVFLQARTAPSADGLRQVTSVLLQTPDEAWEVSAARYIDATADIVEYDGEKRVKIGREFLHRNRPADATKPL